MRNDDKKELAISRSVIISAVDIRKPTNWQLSPEERAVLKEKTQVVWDEFKNEIDPAVLQMVLDTQK